VKITPLGQRHDMVGPSSQLFGFRTGGTDFFVFKQRRHHISKHGFPVAACSVEFYSGFLVSHF
jgi:hypothetical protein